MDSCRLGVSAMLEAPPSHVALVTRLLTNRLPHATAMAFGSRVSGWPFGRGAKPYSDLDVALWGLSGNDDLALAHLRADLEESNLPWRVDLTDATDLPAPLRDLVISAGYLLCGQPVQPALAT